MTIKYRIKWMAVKTGAVGYSKPIFDTHDEAHHMAQSLDKEDLAHSVHMSRIVEMVEVDDDGKIQLANDPNCPHCDSDNVKRERAYRSPWLLITCRACGETSEVDAEPPNEAAVRY